MIGLKNLTNMNKKPHMEGNLRLSKSHEKRVLELETSLLYFSKSHADIVHNLNSSTHKLLSHTFILARNFDYLEDLIATYQELGSKEVASKIKEVRKFRDGVDIKSIKSMSMDTVKSIETTVHQIHKDSNKLHVLAREINRVLKN